MGVVIDTTDPNPEDIMTTIRQQHGVALVQIDSPEPRYHVVSIDYERGQVYSRLASDLPSDGGLWYARIGESGVRYVSTGRTYAAALRHYQREVRQERLAAAEQAETDAYWASPEGRRAWAESLDYVS